VTVTAAHVECYVDPVCPFCWQTSAWLRQVQRLADVEVTWRFISLRFVNEARGYDGMPALYPTVHQQGTRLLRVLAAAREHAGNEAVGALYAQLGAELWDAEPPEPGDLGAVLALQAAGLDPRPALLASGLPDTLAAALDDECHDDLLRRETADALRRAGKDVGTPILGFDPPDGPAFFGPVIAELPSDEDAVALFEAVERLARWPGFAELKRSLRGLPDVAMLSGLRAKG
jgi:hypothetical protein